MTKRRRFPGRFKAMVTLDDLRGHQTTKAIAAKLLRCIKVSNLWWVRGAFTGVGQLAEKVSLQPG